MRDMKVLIVDDDSEVRGFLSELLTSHGHSATACASAVEARALVAGAAAGEYDVILLDVVLPGIPKGSTHIYYRYVIRVPAWRRDRGALGDALARLEHRGVQCRRPIFRALHRYLQLDGFPQCEDASETAISIPLYPSMTDEEVDQTAHVVLEELGSLT